MKTPLADRIRPKTLDEVVGQKHLIGEGKILRNIIENDEVKFGHGVQMKTDNLVTDLQKIQHTL